MIEIENLSHQIGGKPILSGIDLTLPTGGVTALIGPNGAGKSTLLKLISRHLSLQSGGVTLDGVSLASIPADQLALKLATVSQEVGVASRLRIKDLVAFGRWPHAKGRPDKADHNVVDRTLQKFGLVDLQNRFLDEVSGGQRQRAFVAMAYAQDTDWLLLDEPLNNLDLVHARALMAELKRMALEDEKSIVIVLHDLNYAVAWADRIVGLRGGQLEMSGKVKTVATGEILSALYETKIEVEDTASGRRVWYYS